MQREVVGKNWKKNCFLQNCSLPDDLLCVKCVIVLFAAYVCTKEFTEVKRKKNFGLATQNTNRNLIQYFQEMKNEQAMN